MAVTPPTYVVHRPDAIAYEPMLINGAPVGEAHELRGEGSRGNAHESCLWRTDAPARYEYLFTGDESFCVLEGSVSIELKDTRSVWTFIEPFKKFTVISN